MANQPLFNYLSDSLLRHINVKMYDRFKRPEETLPADLKPLAGAWHAVAIGQGMVGGGNPHLDNDDGYFGYNVVTGWGGYESAQLDLYDLKTSVQVKKGEAVMFFGRGLVHGASHVTGGVRNIVDLFCHQNVFGWHQRQLGHNTIYKPTPTAFQKPNAKTGVRKPDPKAGRKKWVPKDIHRKRKAADN